MDEQDDELNGLYQECPNCNEPFDEIAFEYQFCPYCKCNVEEYQKIIE